ncbi:expressed unknown protein [Seminavis robusta]|uniref:Uncharacterized protein n=1 Tax=Seminavis robusta TaxID=568900 RepID=A0A9N8HGS1_9STRA|nr:expressed unknown protein [Seminavis robusta]|eukprot:Sro593_g172260.1 n/a (909) ;mRNA; r:15916-18642
MFRSKDRRKLMRQRSAENAGAEQPVPPIPIAPSATNATSNSNSAPAPVPAPAVAVPVPAPGTEASVTTAVVAPATTNHRPTIVQPPPLVARRSTIHRTTASLSAYRATPITKHYSLNNQILTAFESHYENKLFTIAYAIGLQFVETALLEIPKHGYYYSTRHTQERTANSLNAIRVSNMLQTILEQQQQFPSDDFGMDLKLEFRKVQTLASLALEQAEESSKDQYEANRAAVETQLNEMKRQEAPTTLLGETCGPLLDSFTEAMCPPGGLSSVVGDGQQKYETVVGHAVPGTATAVVTNNHDQSKEQSPKGIPPPPPSERTMSSMMREMMHQPKPSEIPPPPPPPPGVQIAQPITATVVRTDPPALHPSLSQVSRASITHPMLTGGGANVPPPPSLDGGWMIMPDLMPDRPEFGRQMSGRTYADHVALERALYLSGLEVQPELVGLIDEPPMIAVPPDDDDQWMLEHALKESEREMEALREQEELQILEACQQSEVQQYELPQHLLQPTTVVMPEHAGAAAPPAPQLQRRLTKSRLQIETLHMLYHEDFVHLWNSGRLRVTQVDTYQGKNPGSTNGCTVIAPLLCIHHFINFTEPDFNGQPRDDPGLPDETIKSVIDEEVPSILPKVREELGVMADAFLIPSDSHDYLLKNQLLSQDQFVTVIGGNILDERHLNELIRVLVEGTVPIVATEDSSNAEGEEGGDAAADGSESGGAASSDGGGAAAADKESTNGETPSVQSSSETNNNSGTAPATTTTTTTTTATTTTTTTTRDLKKAKIACTLFFHEHVVSILKLRRAHNDKAWFDIIDSLPSKQMLSREVGAESIENRPAEGGAVDAYGISLSEYEAPMNTARIRCLDEEALSVALRWYACAKFNSENLNYIDAYPWDDQSTDFDPRVFQAFVWTEAA